MATRMPIRVHRKVQRESIFRGIGGLERFWPLRGSQRLVCVRGRGCERESTGAVAWLEDSIALRDVQAGDDVAYTGRVYAVAAPNHVIFWLIVWCYMQKIERRPTFNITWYLLIHHRNHY